jgi:hypothetical protein
MSIISPEASFFGPRAFMKLKTEPKSQDVKPRVLLGVHLPFYIANAGGETRVKPWVWRPEMWALVSTTCNLT